MQVISCGGKWTGEKTLVLYCIFIKISCDEGGFTHAMIKARVFGQGHKYSFNADEYEHCNSYSLNVTNTNAGQRLVLMPGWMLTDEEMAAKLDINIELTQAWQKGNNN